jgi:hypothetical protein
VYFYWSYLLPDTIFRDGGRGNDKFNFRWGGSQRSPILLRELHVVELICYIVRLSLLQWPVTCLDKFLLQIRKESIQIFPLCQCKNKLLDSLSFSTKKKRFLQLTCYNFLCIHTVAYSPKARIVESQQRAVSRQRPVHSNGRMLFSGQSVPIAPYATRD